LSKNIKISTFEKASKSSHLQTWISTSNIARAESCMSISKARHQLNKFLKLFFEIISLTRYEHSMYKARCSSIREVSLYSKSVSMYSKRCLSIRILLVLLSIWNMLIFVQGFKSMKLRIKIMQFETIFFSRKIILRRDNVR
jgi:hypothetical protein